MFGHAVGVGAGKLRGLPVMLVISSSRTEATQLFTQVMFHFFHIFPQDTTRCFYGMDQRRPALCPSSATGSVCQSAQERLDQGFTLRMPRASRSHTAQTRVTAWLPWQKSTSDPCIQHFPVSVSLRLATIRFGESDASGHCRPHLFLVLRSMRCWRVVTSPWDAWALSPLLQASRVDLWLVATSSLCMRLLGCACVTSSVPGLAMGIQKAPTPRCFVLATSNPQNRTWSSCSSWVPRRSCIGNTTWSVLKMANRQVGIHTMKGCIKSSSSALQMGRKMHK